MTDQNPAETQLITEIIAGDRENYRKIVDRYSPMVFYVIRSYEKDEEEVKELAQQIFVKAYERIDSFNGKSKFSSWLYSLAMNHCRDYKKNVRRNHLRFSEIESDFLDKKMMDLNFATCSDLEALEWKRVLDQAIFSLKGDHSEPFLLKYRDGMSYEVMSERLGVGISTLKVRVHRARKELKRLIEKRI